MSGAKILVEKVKVLKEVLSYGVDFDCVYDDPTYLCRERKYAYSSCRKILLYFDYIRSIELYEFDDTLEFIVVFELGDRRIDKADIRYLFTEPLFRTGLGDTPEAPIIRFISVDYLGGKTILQVQITLPKVVGSDIMVKAVS